MSLLLTGSKEHALLAMVIQEAASECQRSGYVGRTAIQKITYFLQVLGVPMRYRFEVHHYGPYCDEVARDIGWLNADDVICDRSLDRQKYSNYAPGPSSQELIKQHAGAIEGHRQTVKNVVRALIPLDPTRLELIATIDYAYRQLKSSGGAGPWKDAVIAHFRSIKGDKFSPEELSGTYDKLVSAGLVER